MRVEPGRTVDRGQVVASCAIELALGRGEEVAGIQLMRRGEESGGRARHPVDLDLGSTGMESAGTKVRIETEGELEPRYRVV